MSNINYTWSRAPNNKNEVSYGKEPDRVYLLYHSLRRMSKKYHQTSSLYKLKGKGGSYRATIIQENIIETFLEQLNIKCNSLNINIMCKFQKFIGEITNYTNNVYTITVGDKSVTIPYSVMHKYPVFPTSMMESGHLKIGGNIHLVKKDEQTFYPDHETYGISNSQEQIHYVDGSYLLKDAKPLKLECSFNELLSKLSNIMPSIPEGKRNEVLQILVNQDLRDEEKQSRLTSLVAFPLDFEESETLEKKKSIFTPANRSKDENAQPKEIVESIVAMCNTSEQKPCKLIIGIDDKTNLTNKLQDEIATRYPNMDNIDEFQNTFLIPFIKSYTYNNPLLLSSLKYNWYSYHGDLVLIIDINYRGAPIVCKGGILPYRCGSSKHCVEGPDMVSMIVKLSENID